MKIKWVSELREDETDALFNWKEQVFPIEGNNIKWAKPKWHLLALDDGNCPLAHIGYADFSICLENRPSIKVIGVGGVVVRPEAQGQSIPGKLFSYLHSSKHAAGISNIFTLFCPRRLESYYRKHGYKTFAGKVLFLQGGKHQTSADFIFMHRGILPSKNSLSIDSEPW